MALKFAITDLYGEQLAVPMQYQNALVTIPYNDSRTAEFTLSAEDPAVDHALALERMLKCWHIWPDGSAHIVFWGPMTVPKWSLQSGQAPTVQIEAHDPSLRLKYHHLTAGDAGLTTTSNDGLVYVGYEGLRSLRDYGKNTGSENTAGIPDLWIGNGTNTHPGAGTRQLKVAKGDEVWQRFKEIADDPFGPDFRLRPVEGVTGAYALLDTFDKTETALGGTRDKRYRVIFQAGFGTDNADSFEYSPAGSSVRNRAVSVQQHGDPDVADQVALRNNPTSEIRYGIYESWESGGNEDNVVSDSVLDGKAKAMLLAYSYPPQNFSFSPRNDERNRFVYGRDYDVAEIISCAAHFGRLRIWLPGFINEVRLRQSSAIGQTITEVDAIPEAGAPEEIA